MNKRLMHSFFEVDFIKIIHASCIEDLYIAFLRKSIQKSIILRNSKFVYPFSKAGYIKINYISLIEDLCTFPLRKSI